MSWDTKVNPTAAESKKQEDSVQRVKENKNSIENKEKEIKKEVPTITPKEGRPVTMKIRLYKHNEVQNHLKMLRTILQCSNATPISCRRNIFSCVFCSDQFIGAPELKLHILEKHKDRKDTYKEHAALIDFLAKLDISYLKCELCDSELEDLEKLITHLVSVHDKKLATGVKHQIYPFKFETDIIDCAICKMEFNSFKRLVEHMNIHFGNFMCEICGAGFVNEQALIRHSGRHKVSSEGKCRHCDKEFSNKEKRNCHERQVHKILVSKIIKCGFCDEKFKNDSKKNEHEQEVHEIKQKMLQCQACEKTFKYQKALTAHTRSFHMMKKKKSNSSQAKETTRLDSSKV